MRRHIGVLLLTGAVLAPLGRFTLVSSVDWTPVDIPFPTDVASRQFTVDKSGRYEAAVRIDRPASRSERDEAECLLGFDWVECSGTEPVELRWTLEASDGAPVRCGAESAGEGVVSSRTSGGRFTPAVAERWIGCFDAHDRSRYTVTVQPIPDDAPLRAFNPRFVVLPSAALDRDEYSTTAAVWLTSLLAGLTASVLIGSRG